MDTNLTWPFSFRLEQWKDVLREQNGSVKSPIFVDEFILSVNFLCCLVGLPLNIFVAVNIVTERRLYSKPRNILLLDNILCNIFTLFTSILEMIYFYMPRDEICLVFTSVVGLPYVLFFLSLLLSLIYRYSAITKPFWHRRRVTIKVIHINLIALFRLII